MQLVNQTAALPDSWVDRLIGKMKIFYGAKFAQQWEAVDPQEMREQWAQELAGFSGPELAAGLDACRTRTFPPTLPEFMTLCRPPVSPEIAFYEAVGGLNARRNGQMGIWTHPAVYWAAVDIGAFDLVNNGYQVVKARWAKALNDQFAKGTWDPVPEVALALRAPDRTPGDARQAKAVAAMVSKSIKPKSDYKAWAHKILDNPAGRSPTVLDVARRAIAEPEPA